MSHEPDKEALAVLAETGRKDFWFFMTKILRLPLEERPHKLMAEEAEGLGNPYRFHLELWPRETWKTMVFTQAYAMWRLVRDPTERILITNAKLDNAKSFLAWIKRQFEANDVFKALYGDMTTDFWNVDKIRVQGADASMREPSIQVAAIDASVVSQHYSLILADDLVNRDYVGTETRVEATITYFRDLIDLMEKQTGQIMFVGTRWAYYDLYGWMIEEFYDDPHWKINVRSAYEENEYGQKELLYPSKYSWEEIEFILRFKGEEEFWLQIMNQPKRQEYDSLPPPNIIRKEEMDIGRMNRFLIIDPAISERETADKTAIVLGGQLPPDKLYIPDLRSGRWSLDETIRNVFEMIDQYSPRAIGVETVAFQRSLIYILNREMRERGRQVPIVELKADRDKRRRIMALEPWMRRGDFYVANHLEGLIRQIQNFPNLVHDDEIDAAAYLLQVKRPYSSQRSRRKRSYVPSAVTGI